MSSNGHSEHDVTPAAEWRRPREEGYVVTLPSGNRARLRAVALDSLLLEGEIPDLLTPIVSRMLYASVDSAELAASVELAVSAAELFGLVAKASMLEPRVVDDPQADDEIALADIDMADKMEIFNCAIAPAVAMHKFRREPVADVGAVPDGEDDIEPAE